MPFSDFPQEIKKFEIMAYEKTKGLKDLLKTHVPFSGSPRKHPYDAKKILLLIDPYGSSGSYYEFSADDISCVQELPSIVTPEKETVLMARIWVKKKSIAARYSPFIVEDMRTSVV